MFNVHTSLANIWGSNPNRARLSYEPCSQISQAADAWRNSGNTRTSARVVYVKSSAQRSRGTFHFHSFPGSVIANLRKPRKNGDRLWDASRFVLDLFPRGFSVLKLAGATSAVNIPGIVLTRQHPFQHPQHHELDLLGWV